MAHAGRTLGLGRLVASSALVAVACGGTAKPTGSDTGATSEHDGGAHHDEAKHHDAGAPMTTPPADAGETPPIDSGGGATDGGGPTPDAMPPATDTDAGFVCHGAGARFATGSPAHSFGPGQNNGQDHFPALVLGPPKGGGACGGSTDVVSLGNGGWVVLEFAGDAIVDGPGPDFIVFENPFEIDCNPDQVFAELGTVSVSEDGVNFTDFPCTATEPPYGACSGWHPVLANADKNTIDPTDPAVAGGDAYDLADIGVKRARYVRITDRPDIGGAAGVYDLDAVAIVHPACP